MSNLIRRVEHLELLKARLGDQTPIHIDQPKDVLAVLAERARTLVALSAVALKAMKVRDLADRLAAVERVLKLRKDQGKQNNKR